MRRLSKSSRREEKGSGILSRNEDASDPCPSLPPGKLGLCSRVGLSSIPTPLPGGWLSGGTRDPTSECVPGSYGYAREPQIAAIGDGWQNRSDEGGTSRARRAATGRPSISNRDGSAARIPRRIESFRGIRAKVTPRTARLWTPARHHVEQPDRDHARRAKRGVATGGVW
jgi:hypothetical protein